MDTKLSKIRAAATSGDWAKALSIASKFPQLGAEKVAITRAHGCLVNPSFYSQLGIDCASAIEAGKAALKAKYSL